MAAWFRSMGDLIYTKVNKRPFLFAGVITGTKTCLADLATQKYWEKKEQINWRRNLVFTIFGAGYLGVFQCFLYSRCFPKWFPGKSLKSAVCCTVFDQTINTGVWYYPLFYVIQDAIMLGKVDENTVPDGLNRYRNNMYADMTNCWKLWIPAQLVNFTLVPVNFRSPYAAGISACWTCILSNLRGDMNAANEPVKVTVTVETGTKDCIASASPIPSPQM
jgi:protein Mpv17